MRLPRANVIALTAVLEEFAVPLMLARAKGELLEGDAYICAVVELQAELERTFVNAQKSLNAIQGQNGIWFAGTHT